MGEMKISRFTDRTEISYKKKKHAQLSKWAGPAKFSQSQDNYKSTNVDYNPFTFRV